MWNEIKSLWDLAYQNIKGAWKAIGPEFTKLWKSIVAGAYSIVESVYQFIKDTIINALTTAWSIIAAPIKTTWNILFDVLIKTLYVLLKYLWIEITKIFTK